jgi:Yip1-like protein
VTPNEPIRPLHDVWLKPRRVFRELSEQPIGAVDQLLAAAQGIMNVLVYCRALDLGAKLTLVQIFSGAVVFGTIAGIVSLHVMAAIYTRIAKRAAHAPTRRQVVHVLAYSGVPIAVALGIWLFTALLAGEVAFIRAPGDVDGFVSLLLYAQVILYALLAIWLVVLQVMGFSEIMEAPVRKAFGTWVLGQLIAALAILFLNVLTTSLFPSA